MEIKTKFALGDTVWIVVESKAIQAEVHSIFIGKEVLFYNLKPSPDAMSIAYEEQKCFATKEELLKYVAGE